MKICIIGTGYVGLVTGAAFAETGNTVYCIDNNQEKIRLLNDGHIPIYEPGLETLVQSNLKKKRLIFSTDLSLGINQADVSFIAVGTPQDKDGSADLKFVFQVCEEICQVAKKEVIIATKSTVPVGTGDKIEELFKTKLKQKFVVFSNPEFLKEGDAVNDFMKPDRIIVGTNEERILPLLKELYLPFSHQRNRIIIMSRRSAEITKYAANAMLALRISFMNELANFCDVVKADINDIRIGIGADHRIGPNFLYSGLGYGGSCFPKDVKALLNAGRENNTDLPLIQACDVINQNQAAVFFKKIINHFGSEKSLAGKKIAVWGLSFKAKTDDIRESPSLRIVDLLLENQAQVSVFDPQAMNNVKEVYGGKLTYCEDQLECLKDADALFLGTEWNDFKGVNFLNLKTLLKSPVIFDGRNLYDGKHLRDLGFQYYGVGINEEL